MDRTTWHYGQTPLNLLVLGVVIGGVVLPLVWTVLPHQGNSSAAARIVLVSRLLRVLPAKRWAVLLADREFVGKEGCVYLRWKGIKRCLRIKETTRIDDQLARDTFTDLHPGEVRALFERTWVYGTWMQVVVTLSPAGGKVIVASDLSVLDVLFAYKKRWAVECNLRSAQGQRPGIGTDTYDGPRSPVAVVWLAVHCAGLDGASGRRRANNAPSSTGQPRPSIHQHREAWLDAAQSGGSVELRHVLDVLCTPEDTFSCAQRRKTTKCQLLSSAPDRSLLTGRQKRLLFDVLKDGLCLKKTAVKHDDRPMGVGD